MGGFGKSESPGNTATREKDPTERGRESGKSRREVTVEDWWERSATEEQGRAVGSGRK